MKIEILYIGKKDSFSRKLIFPRQRTVCDALIESGILEFLNETDVQKLKERIGIFGKGVSLDTLLNDGDRIEIYRPLMQDPKEARRKRAKEIQKHKRKTKE